MSRFHMEAAFCMMCSCVFVHVQVVVLWLVDIRLLYKERNEVLASQESFEAIDTVTLVRSVVRTA